MHVSAILNASIIKKIINTNFIRSYIAIASWANMTVFDSHGVYRPYSIARHSEFAAYIVITLLLGTANFVGQNCVSIRSTNVSSNANDGVMQFQPLTWKQKTLGKLKIMAIASYT